MINPNVLDTMITRNLLDPQGIPGVIGQRDDGAWMLQREPGAPIVYVAVSIDAHGLRHTLQVIPDGPAYRISAAVATAHGPGAVSEMVALILRDAEHAEQEVQFVPAPPEPKGLWWAEGAPDGVGEYSVAGRPPERVHPSKSFGLAAQALDMFGSEWLDARAELQDVIANQPERREEAKHQKAGAVLADLVEERAAGAEEIIATVRALLLRLAQEDVTRALARMIEDNQVAASRVRLITQEDGGDHRPFSINVSRLGEDVPRNGPAARVRRDGWGSSAREDWTIRGTRHAPAGALKKAHAAGVLLNLDHPENTAVLLGQSEPGR